MSDGLPETFNTRRELLGFKQLKSALHQFDVTRLSAEQILEDVMAVGDGWAAGYPLQDDVTLVTMKVK